MSLLVNEVMGSVAALFLGGEWTELSLRVDAAEANLLLGEEGAEAALIVALPPSTFPYNSSVLPT